MNKAIALASAVMRDAIRQKVVWAVVVFAALLSFVAPALPSYGVGVASAVFREVAIALMFVASLVVVLALAATRVPSETERRTVFNVLSRDVRRWHYIAGTWFGIFVVTGAVILLFTLVALAVGGVVYDEYMPALLQASLAVWFEMGVIAAITMLFAARFGPVTSIVGAMAFLFIGHSVDSLWSRGVEGVTAPWFVPNLAVFDVINPVAHGSGITLLNVLGMSGAFLAWVALILLGAVLIFEGRDL